MFAASDYLENQLVKHIFRTGSFSKPAVLAVALFTSPTGDDGSGTEVTGGNYSRVQVNPADANWAATSGVDGHTENVAAIQFPAPNGNWGLITHCAIFDATSGGNMLLHGALTSPMNINSGDPAPKFDAGAFDISFD